MMSVLADVSTIAVGDVLDGKYEVTDVLGEGAMGVVYLARHLRLQRSVALKTLKAEIAQESELVARFEREARAASAIGHANIVQVYDAGGQPGGTPYLVMEKLEGLSLASLLEREGRLDAKRAVGICLQVLAGLEAAHAAGIVHRDLKPDNIFVCSEGQAEELVKIVDFGISKVLHAADPAIAGDGSETRAGMVMGTPLYMSPEQASGQQDLDHRTDLWALICVLYECVSGATPFSGDNYHQILAAVLRGSFVPLGERCPELPAELSQVVSKGLAPELEQRFADARSLAEVLASLPLDRPSSAADLEMLDAFDNLADRFLEQEAEQANQGQAAKLAVAPLASPEPGARPPGAASDRFAPPDSQTGALSLALEVDSPRLRDRPEAPQPSKERRPRRRSTSSLVTRDEASGSGSLLAKLFVLLLLVGGAALGYRYYSLGYLIAPSAEQNARVLLEIEPAGALVLVDGELKEEPTLALVGGASFELRVRAEGRLVMQGQIEALAGAEFRVEAYLPLRIAPLDAALGAEAHALDEVASAEQFEEANAKLAAYADCGSRLIPAVDSALDAEERAALRSALVDECSLSFEVAIEGKPAMASLDGASAALSGAIRGFNRAALEEAKSTGAAAKIVRAKKKAADAAERELREAIQEWRAALSSTQAHWIAQQLVHAKAGKGAQLHARLRAVATHSDAMLRAHTAGRSTDALLEKLRASFAEAGEQAAEHAELYAKSGGSAFLSAIRPLVEKGPGEDALFWHNQAIAIFNELVLPLPIERSK